MNGISYSPTYLVRNSYSYCFRMKVPMELQDTIARKELRYSLKTGNLSQAKIKARLLAGQIQLLFKKIRRGYLLKMNLSETQIQGIIQKYLQNLIKEYDQPAKYDKYLQEHEFHSWASDKDAVEGTIDILNYKKAEYNIKIHSGDYAEAEPIATKLLEEEGISESEIDKSSSVYAKFCTDIYRTMIKGFSYHQRNLRGDDLENLLDVNLLEQTLSQGLPIQNPSTTISQVIEKYFEDGDADKQWTDGETRDVTKASMEMLIDFFGDVPITTISQDMMREYKLVLFKLPPRTNAKYRGRSIKELLKMGPPQKTLSENTVRKHLKRAKTLFKYAVETGKITVNPATRLIIKRAKRPDEERELFTKEELKIIFESDLFRKDKFKKSYQFWVPLLLLYTGARREEICSLLVKDFEQHDGIWCININAEGDKSLKNLVSKRIVPLHLFLVDGLGIIKRVERLKRLKKKRFFPDLNPVKGKYGVSPGRWFKRFKVPLGFPVGEGKDIHSFRHTLTDNLKQQLIDPTIVDELTGHRLEGESMGRYGKKFSADVLYNKAICKLNYGINLDHLKDSKYVIK